MPIVVLNQSDLVAKLGDATPVAEPLGELIATTRVHRVYGETGETTSGIWECSPGRWRRKIVQAEFCHFFEGELTFEPDVGEPVHIKAGDAVIFPANSTGIWDIKQTARKFYVLFNPAEDAAKA